VSKSTLAPSTAADMIASGAGYKPRVFSISIAGAMVSICAICGLAGVPPGMR
jgi:hypothetical protein